jgi:hypothetical protein
MREAIMRELNRVIVSSIPARGEVYSIHLYETYGMSVVYPGIPVSSINKTDRHDVTEIYMWR